ncbi:cytochrome-c peroxidase [Oryzibacter oryziterrae]|uniref:cytochrome-c peroxidase n=1 Tax=Oryzibacter oryziterrae TaxID=2766474 RepID=UPI001F00211D|nr:cytochrome c peroxidase [Oryzibacter oryziterrae]
MARRSALLAAGFLSLFASLPGQAADAPAAPAVDAAEARIELGRRLFYDADLSINGTMACATCHEQKRGFTDGNVNHLGALDDPAKRNVPGLANVGALHNLTWANNRLSGLAEQALTPIFGDAPVEMGMKGHEADLLARLSRNPCYPALFKAAFPDTRGTIDLTSALAALEAFERTFVSDSSDYDKAARGELALSPAAEAGKALFLGAAHCATCHTPPLYTDDAFHAIEPPGTDHGDRGLADVTGKPEDRDVFRTPSLRNVALSDPYWHDGRATTIPAALALHMLPPETAASLTPDDITALTAFLGTLTDVSFTTNPALSLPPAACPALR